MAVITFDHCVIHVGDWERSIVFYRDVLGAGATEDDKAMYLPQRAHQRNVCNGSKSVHDRLRRASAHGCKAAITFKSGTCQDVWSGCASQDDVGRLTNVRAASMYSALMWSFSSGPAWVSARIQD